MRRLPLSERTRTNPNEREPRPADLLLWVVTRPLFKSCGQASHSKSPLTLTEGAPRRGTRVVSFCRYEELCRHAYRRCVPVGRIPAFAQERKPNVVIILTDDQGTLDANCYGSSDLYTPAIDSLAADGVRFTQAYSHTVCCPTRAMLLTGRQPQRGNVNDWMQGPLNGPKGRNMLTSEVTLAETLREAGYRTGLFGKWHLGGHRDHGPTKQGFDEFFGIRDGFIENYTHYFLHREGYHDLYEGVREVFHRGGIFPT